MIVVVRIVFPTAKALAADLHERLGHDKGYWPTADRQGLPTVSTRTMSKFIERNS